MTTNTMTKSQEQQVDKFVAQGMNHRTAIRFVLTGRIYVGQFSKPVTKQLVKAVRSYEHKHGIA